MSFLYQMYKAQVRQIDVLESFRIDTAQSLFPKRNKFIRLRKDANDMEMTSGERLTGDRPAHYSNCGAQIQEDNPFHMQMPSTQWSEML